MSGLVAGRTQAWTWCLVGVLLAGLVLTVGSPVGGGSATSTGAGAHPLFFSPGSEVSVAPHAAAPGQTVRTLTLFNNSVRAGNYLPLTSENPLGVAYDSANGTVWFSASQAIGVANASTGVGIRFLPVGFVPYGIAFDNRSDRIFVAQSTVPTLEGNLSVFNATTYAFVGNVSVGYEPQGVAYDWQDDRLFVTDHNLVAGYENVTVVNATSLRAVGNVTVGGQADYATFAPTLHEVFVSNHYANTLTEINATSLSVAGTVTFTGSGGPQGSAYDPGTGLLYVTGINPGLVEVDPVTHSVVGNLTISASTVAVALDPSSSTLYVVDSSGALAWTVNAVAGTVVGSIGLGTDATPDAVAYDASAHLVLVACEDAYYEAGSNVTEISSTTNTTVGSIGIELLPGSAVYDAAAHAIFIYDGGTGRVDEMNDTTDRVERSVFVAYTPHTIGYDSGGLALDPDSNGLYVDYETGYSSGLDFVNLSTFTVTATFPGTDFAEPSGIAYASDTNVTFVTNTQGNTVTLIDAQTNTYIGTMPVGDRPLTVFYDPQNGLVYVGNAYAAYVSVLNATSGALMMNLSTGDAPLGFAYDSTNHDVYVADSLTSEITRIYGDIPGDIHTTNITVQAGGYPNWVAYDAANDSIEVSASSGSPGVPGELAVVNGTNQSFAGSIAVGTNPGAVVWDPAVDQTFVTDYNPGSVSVVTLGAGSSPPPPVVASLAAVPSTVELGQSMNFTTTTSGGTPPLAFAYSTLPYGCVSSDAARLLCTPTQPGVYVVGVNVTDAATGHASATATLTVLRPAGSFSATLAAVPASIALGQSSTLTTGTSGGIGPYTYTYQGLPAGCSPMNVPSLLCTPTVVAAFPMDVIVQEGNGTSSVADATLTVTAGAAVLEIVSFVADPSTVPVNVSSELTVTTSGGTAPLTYLYSALPPGCSTANSSRIPCVPTVAGTYHPSVTVTDANRTSRSATTTLNVTTAPNGPTPGSSSSPLPSWWWILPVLVAVSLVVFFFVWARRRRKEETATPPTAPPST